MRIATAFAHSARAKLCPIRIKVVPNFENKLPPVQIASVRFAVRQVSAKIIKSRYYRSFSIGNH